MNDDLFILLQSKLDKDSLPRIQGQLKELQSKLASINIKLDLGDIDKQTKNMFSNITKQAITETEATNRAFERLSNNIRRYKENMGSKIDMMEMGKVVDPAEIERMRNVLNGLSASTKGVTETMKDLTTSYTITNRESQTKEKALTVESNAYKKLTSDIEMFKKVQGERLGSLSKNTNADTKEIEKLNVAIKGLSVDTPNARMKMSELRTDVSLLGKASESTGHSFGLLTRYFSAHAVISVARQAISSMTKEVYELDKALIELKKTTSMSDTELTSFSKFAYKEASELGRSGIDFTNAVADFRRGGYDLADATKMAKNALLTLNIGDGITSVEQSSKGLISVTKALKMSAEDSIQVLDKVNNVANNTSISFDALYEILTKSTGVLSQTGSSLDEIISMSNSAYSTLRDSSAVATGLNSISVRLLAVKEGAKEAEGEIVSNLEPTLKRIAGVSIMDDKGLRSMYDILADLAKVYPTLNKEQQQLITTQIGGRQQIKTITALLQNWDEAEKALAFSLNSTGSAMAEQANYAQGLEYKLNNLKTAWSSLAQTSLDSNFIKGVVDGTTSVVKFVDAMGGMMPVVLGVGTMLTLLFAPAIATIVSGIWASVPALAAASSASTVLGLSFGWITAIAVGITALSSGLIYLSKSSERAQQTVQTLKQELSDLQADQSAVATLGEQYDALAQLKKESGLNNEEQREFTRIQNELKKLLPTINGYYNDQGNFIIDASESMSTFNKEIREYNQNKREELAIAASDVLSGNAKRYKKEADELERLSRHYELFKKQMDEGLTVGEDHELNTMSYGVLSTMEQVEEKLKDVTESYNNAKDTIHDNIRDIIKNTDAWKIATEKQRDAMLRFLSEQDGKKLDEWANQVKDGEGAANSFTKELSKMPEVIEYVNEMLEQSESAINNTVNEFTSLEEAQENVSKAFKDTTKDIETLDNTMAKLREGKVLSKTEVLNLVDAYGLSMDSIQKVTGGYKIEEGALESLRKTKIDSIKASIEAEQRMSDAVRDATNARLKSFGVEIQGLEDLARARGAIFSAQATMGNQAKKSVTDKYGSSGDSGITAGLINTEYERLLEQQGLTKESINLAQKGLDEYEKSINQVEESRKRLSLLEADSGKLWSAPSASKAKKTAKTDKSQLPKYLTQGYDDTLKEILAKSDKLEREIEQANAKILNAQLLGNTEEELALQKQLEGMYDQRIELEKEKSIALIGLRKKVASELAKQNFDVLKGINLETITEKQLADINRKLDAQIDKANKAKNDKLANSYKVQQDMINEHVKAMLDANSNINSISLNVRDLENESIERSIALIERKYELEDKLINDRIRDIDVELMLTKDGSEDQLRLQKQKYDEQLNIQNNYLKKIKEYREQEIEMDAEVIQKQMDMWYDAERERLNMLKTMGERAKKLKLDSLNLEQEELNNAQKATQTLVDMVIKMLKQQYAEEKKLIQENSKAKEDAIKKEIDGYKKIIDAKKKSLREDKDNKDYDKELKVKQKKVSDVENKILTLANDNSKKAQAERLKLEEEKLTYIDELNDFQENRSIELQEKALDEELKRYEDAKNEELNQYKTQKDKELKILDDHLAKEGNLRAEAIRLIENKNRDLYDKLIRWNEDYGTGIRDDVSNAWDNAYDAMDKYNNGQLNVLDTLKNIVRELENVKSSMDEVNNSSWQDYVDSADIAPDKSRFPVYETEPDKKTPAKEEKKYTEKEAKELIQKEQQSYFHKEAQKAKDSGNEGLLKWVQSERKQWGMDSMSGAILSGQDGKIPDDAWKKHKAKYGFLKGGETSRTGFHWLDGSQKLPERILSPEQTQSFNKLVEFLPNVVSKLESFTKEDNSKREILLQIDNMINVEGDLDERVDIVALMRDATDEMMAKINKALNVRYGW